MTQADTTAPTATRRKLLTIDGTLSLGAAAVLTVSLLFTPEAPPAFSICTFHSVTGLPCPGCGLTRAFCAISHGRMVDAWTFNPFGFCWYALTVFVMVRPLLTRRVGYLERERKLLASHWGYIVPIVLVVAMWSFGLYRMWHVAQTRTPPTVTSTPESASSPSDPSGSPAPARDAGASPSIDTPA